MFQLITYLSSAITLLSVLFAISSFIPRAIKYFNRGRYIKNILLSKGPISLSFPIHENVVSNSLAKEYNMIVLDEVIVSKNVINFCNEINKTVFIFTEKNIPQDVDDFHIGGPLSNSRVNVILKSRFADKFVIHVPKRLKPTYETKEIDTWCVEYNTTDSDFAYTFGNSDTDKKKHHYEVIEGAFDLIFLIRIAGDKAEHILFCTFGTNAQKAVNYLTTNTKRLYKILKNRGRLKSNYFIVMPIHTSVRSVDSFAYTDDVIDLTDTMFK